MEQTRTPRLAANTSDAPGEDPANWEAAHQAGHFAAIIESSEDAIVSKSLDGIVLSWNRAAERMFGYSAAEMIGQPITRLFPPDRLDEEAEIIARLVQGLRVEHFVTVRTHRNGTPVHVSETISPIRDPQGRIIGASKITRDISDRVRAERTIWRQMNFDSLTGLGNRRLFMDRLQGVLGGRAAGPGIAAVIAVDLDHFKDVNDQHGHAVGDLLLVQAAARLHACVQGNDLVARLAADEYAILLPGRGRDALLDDIASQIVARLAAPFTLADQEVVVTASLGIVVADDDGLTPDALMHNLDLAMDEAKRRGRHCIQHFTKALALAAQRRQRLLNDLRSAVAARQLCLHFQPILDLRSGLLRKCEALLRWHHPELGAIPPLEFIPLAEETGLIVPIGDWVFREAARQAGRWRSELGMPVQVAVNLSPAQLLGAAPHLSDWVREVRALGLPPGSLSCEITESMVVARSLDILEHLTELREAGVEIAIDDFGTGYSGYATLGRLPLDTLKIDRTMLSDLEGDPRAQAVCTGIVAMAHALGLDVVAEGVETPAQLDRVREIGCDHVQGYLVCAPGPAAVVTPLLGKPFQSSSSASRPGNSTEV